MNEPNLYREWLLVESISGAVQCSECSVLLSSEVEVTVCLECEPISLETLHDPGRSWDGCSFVESLIAFPFIPSDETFAVAQAFESSVGFVNEPKFSSPALYLLRKYSEFFHLRVFKNGRAIHSTQPRVQVNDKDAAIHNGWEFSVVFQSRIHDSEFAQMLQDRVTRLRIPTKILTQTSIQLWPDKDG